MSKTAPNWRKPWTQDELDMALRLANDDGLFPSEIASLLGRNRVGVSLKLLAQPTYVRHSKGEFMRKRGKLV
jgi:hypothetical protein